MESMDVNKAVAGILVAGIAFFITGLLGDNLIHVTEPAKTPFTIQGLTPAAEGGGAQKPEELPPIAPLLASADVKKGEQFASTVCAACHSFNKGGHPIVGPNLYGIVGDPHDHEAGFDYSPALEKFKGQPWTFDALNHWLYKPSEYAPGTRMTFAGIPQPQLRADVIDYLRTLSDHPEPLPKVEPTAAKGPAPAAKAAAPAASQQSELDARLAKADPAKGKQYASGICAACHSFDEGGHPIVGPNLYNVVGGPHDHEAGFNYSPAMEKFKGQPWTFAALDKWLTNPQAYAPGTLMTFAGIPQPQLRADVIAYLDSLSHHPVPLPKAAGAEKTAGPTMPATGPAPAGATTPPPGTPTGARTGAAPNNAPAGSPSPEAKPVQATPTPTPSAAAPPAATPPKSP